LGSFSHPIFPLPLFFLPLTLTAFSPIYPYYWPFLGKGLPRILLFSPFRTLFPFLKSGTPFSLRRVPREKFLCLSLVSRRFFLLVCGIPQNGDVFIFPRVPPSSFSFHFSDRQSFLRSAFHLRSFSSLHGASVLCFFH